MKVDNGARFARKYAVFAHVVHAMRAPNYHASGSQGGKVSSVTLSAIDPAVLLPPRRKRSACGSGSRLQT